MNTESIRFLIAVAWSMVKVAAVTVVLGGGLFLAAYFITPLDFSGPKIAMAGIVSGLMGAAFWYARHFPALREQGRRPGG